MIEDKEEEHELDSKNRDEGELGQHTAMTENVSVHRLNHLQSTLQMYILEYTFGQFLEVQFFFAYNYCHFM